MGPDRRHAGRRVGLSTATIAQVVPDLATFAVDDGFSYSIPDGADVAVGSIVRIPLGGRRVRGFVVGLRRGDASALKPIVSVSGDAPAFTRRLLETLRWAAIHYVAPLSVVLGKAAPPNLPRLPKSVELPAFDAPSTRAALALAAAAAATGWQQPTVVIGDGPWPAVVGELSGPALAAGRSVLVVCPTLAEAEEMATAMGAWFPGRVVTGASGLKAKEVTAAWSAVAGRPGMVLVGTREVAAWPVAGLGLAVVLEDGRRGLKDRQSPTVHAREVLRRRATVERFTLTLLGAVPTTDAMGTGPSIVQLGARPWPLVEVVDRGEEPPGGGFVTGRVRLALRTSMQRGGRAFVFTHRRGYAPAFRCVQCRNVRRCEACGARPGREAECPRCGAELGPCPECGGRRFEPLGAAVGRLVEELAQVLGGEAVGEAGSGRPVEVGTERDLVGAPRVELAAIVDADGLMLAPNYRAEEDALRLMARVAQLVGRGRGRRCMVQTGLPGHNVIEALRRAEPEAYLERELATRAADGFPPAGELLVVETERSPAGADVALREAVGARGTVLGPAPVGDRQRWLVQGPDLGGARLRLRGLVHDWREAGARVRVDADPIDL